jgi:DNA-3-methyladenine glycosylase II
MTTNGLSFDLSAAMSHLGAKDERLASLIAETVQFRPRGDAAESPYEALFKAITYQSISGKAAAVIFGRIKALSGNGRPPSPEQILKLRKPVLRKAGLSTAKILAVKDLARKTLEGIVPTREEAGKLSDEELINRLVFVRGIGAWTVEMFLIFNLGRPDVLPIHDLGVRKGWAITYGKKHMPTPKELLAFAEQWRPYRTIGSWYMWRACQQAGSAGVRKILPAKIIKRRKRKVVSVSSRKIVAKHPQSQPS